MPKLNARLPKYRLHRHSGQAVLTLHGKDHYVGAHGRDASRAEYDRVFAEWRGDEVRVAVEMDAGMGAFAAFIKTLWPDCQVVA